MRAPDEPSNPAPPNLRTREPRTTFGPLSIPLAALLLAGLVVALAPRVDVPPFVPAAGQVTYQATDPDARVLVEPWLHAPWRGSRPVLASVIVTFTVIAAGVSLALALGATPLTAWFAILAALASTPFFVTVAHAADPALAIALIWISWGVALVATRRRRPMLLLLAAGVWAAAVVTSWLAIAAAPVILLAWMHAGRSPRDRAMATVGVCALGAAAILAHVAWTASAVSASTALGVVVTTADVWAALFEHVGQQGAVQFARPDLPSPSVLSLGLAAVALLFCDWPRWVRLGLIASGATLVVVCLEWPAWCPEALLWMSWAATPLVAAGLTWSIAQIWPRWRTLGAVVVGIVLVGASVLAAWRPPGGRDSRALARHMQRQLDSLERQGRPIALVAEDPLVDSALAAWAKAPRLSQRPEIVSRALAAGLDPLAGPAGRSQLELFGFGLQTVASLDPAPHRLSRVVERLQCATTRRDRWSLLPGIEYTGRLGLEVPPAPDGRLVLIVGDDLPVQLRATLASGHAMALREQPLMRGPGSGTPPPDYWLDGGDPAMAPPHVVQVTIPADPVETRLVSLYLGRRAPRVLARLHGFDEAARGRVCAAPLGPDALWGQFPGREIALPLDEPRLFGVGWHGIEDASGNRFRWTSSEAAVLVPSAVDGPIAVRLDAAPAMERGESSPDLALRANGLVQPTHRMRPGVARYEWILSHGQWMAGTNELLFSVSQSVRPADGGSDDTRVLGLRVHGLTLARR